MNDQVHYTAGPEGFKAKINSNEPYLKNNANPADVMLFVEDPPHNALNSGNYNKQPISSYPRDEQNDKNDKQYDDFDNNQMKDQIYRAAANRVRAQDMSYANNNNNNNNGYGLGRMRQFLDMMSKFYHKSEGILKILIK